MAQRPERRQLVPQHREHTFLDPERRQPQAQRSEQCCTHLLLGRKLQEVHGSQRSLRSDEGTQEQSDALEQPDSQGSRDTTELAAVPEQEAKAELYPVTESRLVGHRLGSDLSLLES